MIASDYAVTGMVCGHCVGFVTEEIERIAGVTSVEVDLIAGTVTVTSDNDLDTADVRAAVEEAGYEIEDGRI